MTEPDSTTDERNSTTDTTSLSRRQFVAVSGAATVGAIGVGSVAAMGNGDGNGDGHSFTISLENVSDGETLTTSAGGEASAQPVPLSPLVYAVHSRDEPVFSHGEPERDNGLEELAEDGMPDRLVESLMGRDTVVDAGAVAVANGADEPGPLTPGHTYECTTDAATGSPRSYLSVVTMFVPSNDLFFSLGGAGGMPLFDGDSPNAGNVTEHVLLWDAGTEVNQEPGVGDHQVQRQRAAGVGDVERGTVAPVDEVNGYDYPDVSKVLKLTVTPG